MPLQIIQGKLELFCVNDHGGQLTMTKNQQVAIPTIESGGERGAICTLYSCKICGYVETYAQLPAPTGGSIKAP